MKYVIFNIYSKLGNRAHVLIFPERMTHSIVAEGYTLAYMRGEGERCAVYSAGFCYIENGTWKIISVGSESLKIPHSKDADKMLRDKRILNLHDASGGFFQP